MKTKKNLGIWMDYSSAHLIDLDQPERHVIESKFSPAVKEEVSRKGEKHLLSKEQQMQGAYFKEIADKLIDYDQVLLFGPTNAKAVLHNYLNGERHFEHVKIDVESTDKLTDNEKHAFVKKHFNH